MKVSTLPAELFFTLKKKTQHQVQQAADKWKEKAQKDNQHVSLSKFVNRQIMVKIMGK